MGSRAKIAHDSEDKAAIKKPKPQESKLSLKDNGPKGESPLTMNRHEKSPANLLQLQQTVGNKAVQRMLMRETEDEQEPEEGGEKQGPGAGDVVTESAIQAPMEVEEFGKPYQRIGS